MLLSSYELTRAELVKVNKGTGNVFLDLYFKCIYCNKQKIQSYYG